MKVAVSSSKSDEHTPSPLKSKMMDSQKGHQSQRITRVNSREKFINTTNQVNKIEEKSRALIADSSLQSVQLATDFSKTIIETYDTRRLQEEGLKHIDSTIRFKKVNKKSTKQLIINAEQTDETVVSQKSMDSQKEHKIIEDNHKRS